MEKLADNHWGWRPRVRPGDRRLIRKLAAKYGHSSATIAAAFGCSVVTIDGILGYWGLVS